MTDLQAEYTLKKKIGQGRYPVFLAESPARKDCALKILRGAEEDEGIKRMFDREVASLKKISPHPNVVSILDSGYRPDNFRGDFKSDENIYGYFIAQELIQGISLHEMIRQNRLPPDPGSRVDILIGIAEGLKHIQKAAVLHRDVKPVNVMIEIRTEKLRPVVIDLGISKILDGIPSATLQGALTFDWAPPEYLANSTYVRTSDVFSFGLLAAVTMSGKDLLHKGGHRTQDDIGLEFELLNGIPAPLEQTIIRCLSLEPENRLQSFAIVVEQLKKCKAYFAGLVCPLVVRPNSIVGYTGKAGGEPDFVSADLKTGPVHLGAYLKGPDGQPTYQLYGNRFTYHIKRDPAMPERAFYLIKGKRLAPTRSLEERIHMLPLSADWETYGISKEVPLGADIAPILCLLADHDRDSSHRKQRLSKLRANLRIWQELLDLEMDLKKDDAKAAGVHYASADFASKTVLLLKGGDLRGSDFDIEEFIDIEAADGEWIPVGQVLDFDGRRGEMTIVVKRNLDPQQVLASGRIRLNLDEELSPDKKAISALKKIRSFDCPEALKKILIEPDRLLANAVPVEGPNLAGLSESKIEALRVALGSEHAMLLQGPPGTGKTKFIVALVKEILLRWPAMRILVSAQSNVALDHALGGVRAELPIEIGIVRMGNASKIGLESVKELQETEQLRSWANSIKERTARIAATLEVDLKRKGKFAPAYATAKEIKEFAKEERANKEWLDTIRAQIQQKEVEKKALIALIETNPSAGDSQQKIREIFKAQKEGVARFAEMRTQSEELHSDAAQVESFVKEYARKRAEARESLKKSLGIELNDSNEAESVTTEIGKIESHLEKELRGQSERLALLRQWEAKVSGLGPDIEDDLLAYGVSVVGATCVGAANSKMADRKFDWIIVDEAARANPGELAIPLLKGERYILVGDQQQLPPFIGLAAREKAESHIKAKTGFGADQIRQQMETSLFESLYSLASTASKRRLLEQFRMSKPLGEMVSTLFYEGKLDNSFAKDGSGPFLILDCPLIWVDTSGYPQSREVSRSPGYENPAEAKIVKQLLQKSPGPLKDADVAVLTAYRGQRKLLLNTLDSLGMDNLKVSTIDNFQGKEATCVIYSCVRSNPQANIGFLIDVRRLTVAMSRAKQQLIIVGDVQTLINARKPAGKENTFSQLHSYIMKGGVGCKIVRATEVTP